MGMRTAVLRGRSDLTDPVGEQHRRAGGRGRLRSARMEDGAQQPDELAARLRERLMGETDVAVAYLFGSRAHGDSGPLSDVDVAVLLLGGEAPGRRELELRAVIEGVIATETVGSTGGGPPRVDLVILNDAPVSVAYRVLAQGTLLLSRDERARVAHWVDTVDRYLDMAPLRATLAEGLGHRLEEGRFGRS